MGDFVVVLHQQSEYSHWFIGSSLTVAAGSSGYLPVTPSMFTSSISSGSSYYSDAYTIMFMNPSDLTDSYASVWAYKLMSEPYTFRSKYLEDTLGYKYGSTADTDSGVYYQQCFGNISTGEITSSPYRDSLLVSGNGYAYYYIDATQYQMYFHIYNNTSSSITINTNNTSMYIYCRAYIMYYVSKESTAWVS